MKFAKLLHALTDEPWAVLPGVHALMLGYVERAAGLAPGGRDQLMLDELAAEMRSRGPLAGSAVARAEDSPPYELTGGVAVVEVAGTLVKRASLCFTSAQDVQAAVQAALDDPLVDSVLLSIDSPGGTVDGTKELADFLASAGRVKPLYAYVDGMAASAAYWIASAAREIAAPATASVGSIGVVTVHADWSKAHESAGVRKTVITDGLYKAAGHDAAPLGESARAYIQDRISRIGTIFASAVAANRNLSLDQVRATEARVYLAEEALSLKLVDRIVSDRASYVNAIKQEAKPMSLTMEQLKASATGPVEQIKNEAAPDAASLVQAERARMLGLAEHALGSDAAAKLKALAETGMNAEQVAALAASGLLARQSAPAPAAAETAASADMASRAEVLEAIRAATPSGVAALPGKSDRTDTAAAMAAHANGRRNRA